MIVAGLDDATALRHLLSRAAELDATIRDLDAAAAKGAAGSAKEATRARIARAGFWMTFACPADRGFRESVWVREFLRETGSTDAEVDAVADELRRLARVDDGCPGGSGPEIDRVLRKLRRRAGRRGTG